MRIICVIILKGDNLQGFPQKLAFTQKVSDGGPLGIRWDEVAFRKWLGGRPLDPLSDGDQMLLRLSG